MATTEITSYEDIIDSREVIERIADLEADIAQAAEDEEEPFEEDVAELAVLRALAEEGEKLGDWVYGATLIRESYFVTYAEELAEDITEGMRDATWPFNHIDWDAAADELRVDYTEIEFDGVTYLTRA